MTSPTPMSREELLELAALDAFGLLDEYEAALYTRSFHHATAAIQETITQFQAEITSDPQLLPDVEPGPELRDRVLEAVSKAIEAESVSLEPLALIGRGRRETRDASARIGIGVAGQFWRAATFVLAGALVVALYFGIQIYDRNEAMVDFVVNKATREVIEEKLPDLSVEQFITDPSCIYRVLETPSADTTDPLAMLFINKDTGEALLIALRLPGDSPNLTLTAADESGDVFSSTFARLGAVTAVLFDTQIAGEAVGSLTWTISAVGESPILST
jgi:hypothetical protein